jgi:hypothetical protein
LGIRQKISKFVKKRLLLNQFFIYNLIYVRKLNYWGKKKMLNRLFKLSTLVLTATLIFMNIPVSAQGDTTVEGDTTRFVTGSSFASQIEMTGYNVDADTLYLNLQLNVPSTTTTTNTVSYTVKVYDGTSTLIGSITKSTAYPTTADTAANPRTTIDITNEEITSLSKKLTSEYRIVVTVTDLTTTN